MNKNWKTMLLPVVGIVSLGLGTLLGFDSHQVDTLNQTLTDGVTVIATLVSLYGVWKSHDTKKVEQPAQPTQPQNPQQ